MSPFAFQNFDLLIEPDPRVPASYAVRVVNSPAGEAAALVQLPFDVAQISAFYQAIHGTATLPIATIQPWGEQLFAVLFVGEIKSALQRSLDLTLPTGQGLRLRLQLADDHLLWILPWEYLYEPTYQRFLAQSAKTPIVRTIALPRKISPLPLNSPLQILVVLVNPLHQAERKQAEWAHIHATLQEAISGGTVQLKLLYASNVSGLQRHLRRYTYHVVHLIGSEGFHTAADGAALSLLFQQHAALRLVLLTGEPLGDQSASLPLHQLTQHLLQRGIVAVVAAQFAQQPTALAFVGEFYSAIIDGYPLDAAMGEARAAVALLQDETWGMPMLGMLTTDGRFFQEAERVAQPDRSQSTVKPDSPESDADAAAPLNNSGAINSGGGTVIIGNVYTDNFTGRDVVNHEPRETENAVPSDSVSKLPRYDSTALPGHPLQWPPLWDKTRPADSHEIAEWVSMAHLMLNPFGPEQAEWDPELARYRVYPAVFDRCLRGTRSAVVYGAVGSGKTACSLLLADLCHSHAFAASAFPVVCKIDSDTTARSTSDAIQTFVLDQLTRALVAFFALNPVTFLRLERNQKLAVVACLRQVFGAGETIKTRFEFAGLGAGEPEQWLQDEVQELAGQVDPSGLQRRDWVNIIANARPAGFARTFLICDMADEALSTVAVDAAFLQALIRYIVSPELRAVHLKALLPEQLRNHLRVPGHVISDTLRWTVDELGQVLQVRVIDEKGFSRHFEEFFDPDARFTNPVRRLAEAANGSPRQLINLGNQLLAAHVQWRRGQIELTNADLALVLHETNVGE